MGYSKVLASNFEELNDLHEEAQTLSIEGSVYSHVAAQESVSSGIRLEELETYLKNLKTKEHYY